MSGDVSLGTKFGGNRGLVVKSIVVTLSEGLVISQTNVASVSSAVKSTQKQDLSLPVTQNLTSRPQASKFPICDPMILCLRISLE